MTSTQRLEKAVTASLDMSTFAVAPETPNVAAYFIVGLGAPLIVTLATGEGRGLDAGLADWLIVNRWDKLYIVLPPASRSRTK